MAFITIPDKNDTGAHHLVTGSDDRLNVTSRIGTREYYNNRDKQNLYSFLSRYSCSAGDYVIYIKNTHAAGVLHISNMKLGSEVNQEFLIHKVTGTAGGNNIIPRSRNYAETNSCAGVFKGDAVVTGLTSTWSSESEMTTPFKSELWHNSGGIILNDGEAMAIQALKAGNISITILGYCE